MKETYDSKVTPYKFDQGQRRYLHNPVARVGECFKLKRRWRGPFLIHKISSHNVFLCNPSTDKYVEKSVHINRIKSCYQRDDIPEDDEVIEDMPLVEVTYPPIISQIPHPLLRLEVEIPNDQHHSTRHLRMTPHRYLARQ